MKTASKRYASYGAFFTAMSDDFLWIATQRSDEFGRKIGVVKATYQRKDVIRYKQQPVLQHRALMDNS